MPLLNGTERTVNKGKRGRNEGEEPKNEEAPSVIVDPDGASVLGGNSKRRGGDSNSRGPCGPTGFRNRRIQPLCHLSGNAKTSRIVSERQRGAYRTRQRPQLSRIGDWAMLAKRFTMDISRNDVTPPAGNNST